MLWLKYMKKHICAVYAIYQNGTARGVAMGLDLGRCHIGSPGSAPEGQFRPPGPSGSRKIIDWKLTHAQFIPAFWLEVFAFGHSL